MNITIPPGYKGLVALDKEIHKGKGVVTNRRAAFAAGLTGVYILAAEFVQASRHYPIVFAQDQASGEFMPIAVTGLNQDENLFVGTDGEWLKDMYVPAYVRRWPFFGVRITGEEAKNGNILICVDDAGLEASSTTVFDTSGNPSTDFQPIQTLISEIRVWVGWKSVEGLPLASNTAFLEASRPVSSTQMRMLPFLASSPSMRTP